MRKTLSDRLLKSLASKPAPAGKRYEIMDAVALGLGARVNDKGQVSLVLKARFPKSPQHMTRRTIGVYPDMTLVRAREIARKWREHLAEGRDPADVAERERQRKGFEHVMA